ncbi:hypothetical protein PMIN06_012752 [Paraphaeosphaeria minitans]
MTENYKIVEKLNVEELGTMNVSQTAKAEFYAHFASSQTTSAAACFIADFTGSGALKDKIDGVLSTFIQKSHQDDPRDNAQKEFVWIHIRISLPNAEFDEPRWHQDGLYMRLDPGTGDKVRNKYCLTILGPGTMFKEQTPALEEYASMGKLQGERSQIAKEMEKFDSYSSSTGEVVRCTWKRTPEDFANVHSEPPHTEDRVFLAAVFMSEGEQEDLLAGRK